MLIALLLPFISIPVCYGASGTYTYEKQSTWSGSCQTGTEQSPIDLRINDAKVKDFPKISIHVNATMPMGVITVDNTGHSVTFKSDHLKTILIAGGGLKGDYKVAQFHFHWGKTDTEGSEHLLDGKASPLEMHAVTMKTRFDSLKQALESDDRDALAVFGVFYQIDDADSPAWQGPGAIDEIGETLTVAKGQKETKELNVQFRDLLPNDLSQFFRYNGSLTTPGCNEQVLWTVFQNKMSITQEVLQKFQEIKGEATLNFRKPQDKNEREVFIAQTVFKAQTKAQESLDLDHESSNGVVYSASTVSYCMTLIAILLHFNE